MLVGVVEVVDQFDLGIEQVQQQAITIAQVIRVFGRDRIFQQGDAAQAQFRGNGCGLAHVIGLDGTGGDQGVGALGQRIGGEVFEFAQLVATHGQRRQVVTLDVDITAQPARQALELFQGRGVVEQVQTVKTSQLLFDHGAARVVGSLWTIGRGIYSGNRQSLIAKSAESRKIRS